MNLNDFQWLGKPGRFEIKEDALMIQTQPHTDLWQNTYYHFCNDFAPAFLFETDRTRFIFTVKTKFESARHCFDQCGLLLHLDSKNWAKASSEAENEEISHFDSVVTQNGYSDWATCEIEASAKEIWYRLSRREDNFRFENSFDGIHWKQMRIFHLNLTKDAVRIGIYAYPPEESCFDAEFSDFDFGECQWKDHNGQQPDTPVC